MAETHRGAGEKKASSDKEPAESSAADPLGKLVEVYQVSLAGAALVLGVIGLAGLGSVGYALSRRPHPLLFLMGGAFAVLFALWQLGVALLNAGRRLELRKRGVRFVERGHETDLRWDEITAVDVDRADNTYLGVASVHRRGSNVSRPSGPTTKTEWDVTIRATGGRSIRLRPTFFQSVRDPRKLLSHLRLRAGLDRE